MKTKNIFIASAWPYVNGDIHIGHLAGYFIPADIFARYSRAVGFKTLWVSGADCHGTPITVEADKRKITPEELVKEYIPKVHRVINAYNLEFDLFTSTTTETHKKVTQEFFLNLLENNYIKKKKSLQYYSSQDNKFLPDRYVEGTCPHCDAKDQRADQCESCGRTLDFGELINPVSKLTKSKVELKETEHYFLALDELSQEINKFVDQSKGRWKSWVWSETKSLIQEGLKPRAITRDIDWGISIPNEQIPFDMQIENIDTKKFYVWFEAVIGYFSASIEYCEKK